MCNFSGIFRLAVLFFFLFATGLAAQDGSPVKPYGNLYVFFGYKQAESSDAGGKELINRDTFYTINNNSNLGFNFTYSRYSGVFELGINDYENESKVRVRKVYGNYKFGMWELMVGQDWNPYVKFSHQAANYMRSEGFGSLYEDPTTQLKLAGNIMKGLQLYADIIKPYVPVEKYYLIQNVDNPQASTDTTNSERNIVEIDREVTTKLEMNKIQSLLPKMAIGFDYSGGTVNVSGGAAANLYKISSTDEMEFNKNWIYSYLFYLNSQIRVKPFEFNFSGGYAINPSNFGITTITKGNSTYSPGAAVTLYNLATGQHEIKDTWNIQFYLEAGYQITRDMLLHLGFGYSAVDYPVDNTERDVAWEVYANLKYNLAGLIALTPSFVYRDYMENMAGKEEGKDIYGGILATVSFY